MSTHLRPPGSGSVECQDMQGMIDSRPLTQHYTLLIMFTLSESGGEGEQQHKDETARRRRRRKMKKEEEEGGEWRQKRRVRWPQITTINHQAVNIFMFMLGWPVIGSLGSVCVCG